MTLPVMAGTVSARALARVRDAAAHALDLAGRPVPDRQPRTAGRPPADCEALNVTLLRRYRGTPGSPQGGQMACTGGHSADVLITLTRACAYVWDPDVDPEPDPDAQDADAVSLAADADALADGMQGIACDPLGQLGPRPVVGGVENLATRGGMTGLTMTVSVYLADPPV